MGNDHAAAEAARIAANHAATAAENDRKRKRSSSDSDGGSDPGGSPCAVPTTLPRKTNETQQRVENESSESTRRRPDAIDIAIAEITFRESMERLIKSREDDEDFFFGF